MTTLHNINGKKLYDFKVLDTIDYFILVFVDTEKNLQIQNNEYVRYKNKTIFERVCSLYNELDITLNILNTNFRITKEEFTLITDTFGKNIQISKKDYTFMDSINFTDLILDISKFFDFTKVQNSWNRKYKNRIPYKNGINYIKSNNADSSDINPIDLLIPDANITEISKVQQILDKNPSTIDIRHNIQHTPPIIEPSKNLDIIVEPFSFNKTFEAPINDKYMPDKILPFYTYIIYNTLYNSSIVIVEKKYIIDLIIKDYTDFEIIDSFNNLSEKNTDALKTFFNRQTYNDIDELKKKVVSFKDLYSIEDIDLSKIDDYSEKEKVLMIIDKIYEINTNPADKLPINEIYKRIEHFFPDDRGNLTFRKKISGYLIEFGLTRKRLSNGIYYYGLIEKKNQTYEDIIKYRNDEIETYHHDHTSESIDNFVFKNKINYSINKDIKPVQKSVYAEIEEDVSESIVNNKSENKPDKYITPNIVEDMSKYNMIPY
jgi:hypothetical protein